jgi:tetratricopeptide (TPR) repeat protein
MAVAFNNIGQVFEAQGDHQKALEMNLKSYELRKATHNKQGQAESLVNIALFTYKNKDTINALEYNFKAFGLMKEIGNRQGMGYTLANIATIYTHKQKYDSASKYINQSLIIREELKDRKGLTDVYCGLGLLNFKKNNLSEAKVYALKGLAIAKELGYPEDIYNSSGLLYKIYKKQNKAKEALEMYRLYVQMHDSINNKEAKKANIKSQLKYEYDKKAAADSVIVSEEKKLTTVKLKQEQNQRYYLFGGLALTLLFGIFMFNRFRVTHKQKTVIEKQKQIVETQKHLVEDKQKEIMDSIRYAKRIQQSLLPTEKYIDRILKNRS